MLIPAALTSYMLLNNFPNIIGVGNIIIESLAYFVPIAIIYGAVGFFARSLFRDASKMIFQFPMFKEDETDMPTTRLLLWNDSKALSKNEIEIIAKKVEDDFGIHIIQPCLVSPVRGSGEADVLFRGEILIDFLIGTGGSMVGFVRNNHAEIIRVEPIKPPDKGLDGSNDHILPVAVLCRDFKAYRAIVVSGRLPHQLLPVGQHQHPPVSWNVGEGRGLAAAGWHLHQIGTRRHGLYLVDTFLLVIS